MTNRRLFRFARGIVAGCIATMTVAIEDVDGHRTRGDHALPVDPAVQAEPSVVPAIPIFRVLARCLSDGPDRSVVDCRLFPVGSAGGRE